MMQRLLRLFLVWGCFLGLGQVAYAQVNPLGTDPSAPTPPQPHAGHKRGLPQKAITVDSPVLPKYKAKDTKIESHLGRPRIGHLFQVAFGVGIPGGELQNRFGSNVQVSGAYNILFKNKITLGIEAMYGFSRNINADPISSLRDGNSDIVAIDGSLSQSDITERIWMLPALKIGKLFLLKKRVKNTDWEHAVLVQGGASWFQYKYNIYDVTSDIAQLQGDRLLGYDRLSSGPAAVVDGTYYLQSPRGSFGMFFRAQYLYAFTQSRRAYDFNYGRATTGTQLASLLQLQVGIAFSFFKLDENDYFYY